ncbi:hypothetical protein CBR_g45922 [Chara braunii]|uniref:Integrase catalytic domain-containing protein n=1 Tax=Chara braunii TaxID=69332 RepID=A0A388LZN5_CHABU|nr:hypothetical protein CBR_g45922 [Chara braunii]|eukprot:GBG87766.1 hypothetical protein CBR_g45922 [Chara braunii]
MWLGTCMEKYGAKGETASGGKEALEKTKITNFDLILMDLQLYSETTAAELRKWEQEEAARQQAIQRQMAEAEAACQQAAAEAAAAARLQQQQVEESQNQARYQATMELANEEATYRRILRQQHFRANEEQEEPTEEERSKEEIAVLMEHMLYTCNSQECELLAMRQTFIRHEATFRTQEQKITALQNANSQLQTTVSTGLARVSAVESTSSAVADCSPALAAQAKQLEERINHVVTSLGDISTFAGTSTVSNQLQTLSDRVQQGMVAVVKEWKMPNFKIEKFDNYRKTDPLQWWMAFNTETYRMPQQGQGKRQASNLGKLSTTGSEATSLSNPPDSAAFLAVSLTSEDDAVVASSRIDFQNYAVELVLPLNQPLHVQDSSACAVLPPSDNEPVASPTLLSEDPSTWASLEELDPLTVEDFQWLPLPSTGSLATPHCNALMAHLCEYLHAAVPPPSTDGGVAVVDLRSYLAKIDREHATERYIDIDAPLLYIRIQIGKATCSALIDCGASRNYMSQDIMARVGLGPHVRRKSQPTHVTLADGHMQKSIDRCVDSVPVYVAPLACETMSFDILDTKLDMILGMPWLQSEDHPSPLVPFEFNGEAQHAFHTLKSALLQAPVLSIYDSTLPTKVTTDASGYDIGAVLEQHDGTDWHPVEYFSQKVPLINSLDDVRKKELLAVVTVLERWRHVLLGCQQFTWVTDNNPLTYYKMQDAVSTTTGRWMYFIDLFDFTSKHIPGPSNKAADALSRRADLCALVHSTFGLDEDLQQHFVNGYKSDPGFSTLYADLSSDHPPASNYPIVDGYLLLHTRGKDLLCVPQDRILRTRLLGEYHDSQLAGHLGVQRTLARLRQRFHWPDIISDVNRYIQSCAVCHRNKGRHQLPYGELKPLPIPRELGLSIAMDVTGPFPRDRPGHDGILMVVDRLSNHDVPEDIVNDRDTHLMSAFWTTLMVESGTSMKPSSARHPQTDGQTERAHQTVQMMFRTLISPDQKDWVDCLPDIKFAFNTSVHPAIDVTPFELHHGGQKGCIFADILLPACSPASTRKYRELLAKARANMQKAQVRMQQQANRRRIPCPICAGDLVWVTSEEFALEQHVSRKLLPKWLGPWKVTSAAGDDPAGPSFITEIPPHLTVHPVFHASKLAVYTPASAADFRGRRSHDPPSMDGHQEVDRVLAHRKHGNKPMQYKVTFKQCDLDDTRWISRADLKATTPLTFAHYEKQGLAKEAA